LAWIPARMIKVIVVLVQNEIEVCAIVGSRARFHCHNIFHQNSALKAWSKWSINDFFAFMNHEKWHVYMKIEPTLSKHHVFPCVSFLFRYVTLATF
jgi:hypothetical protein